MGLDPHLLAGSIALSVVHAAIPSHWLPLVLVGRSERWSTARILGATALAGLAHVASTIAIGIAVGLLGRRLAAVHGDVLRVVTPALLALLGIVYLGLELREGAHTHDHGVSPQVVRGRSGGAVLGAIMAGMFLSPCLEIEAYFLVAGAQGWGAIAAVSVVYLVVTVAGMVTLVRLGLAGLSRLDLHLLEQHEDGVVGVTLLILAAVAYALG